MALNLIYPNASSDSVGVFDNNFGQVFINARPMRAVVREILRPLEHPIETGQIITDYSILQPIEIELPVIVMAEFYRDTYQEIRNLFQNRELLTVQTRTGNYTNMIIAEMPHEEKPELYDALPITIKFKQVLIVVASSNFSPADPTQVNTQALGEQSSYAVTPVQTTTASTAPAPTPINGITPQSAQNFYSSVQASTNPTGYTIEGVQSPSGTVNLPLTPPASFIPVTGVQTLTNQQTIVQGFN